MNNSVEKQKLKLEQKKNRLIAEEIRLKQKERKMRTRHLIELGGLIAKAKIDFLEKDVLYGALLSLAEQMEDNQDIKSYWKKLGGDAFKKDQENFTPVIVKFDSQPDADTRSSLRTYGLRWNRFRQEWYGNITDLPSLKLLLEKIKHQIEIIE